jgi:hypothetical protein
MNKTLLAFIAAMLVVTAPICAEITTVTLSSDDTTLSDDARVKLREIELAEYHRERAAEDRKERDAEYSKKQAEQDARWEKENAEWRKQTAVSQAAAKKAVTAFMTLFGAGLMAHGYWHYDAAKQIYNTASPFTDLNLSVVKEQSMAYTNQIGGAIITAMAAVFYYTLPEPSSGQ